MNRELKLFHELLRHMPDAIYFKDRSSRFLAASEFTARILGAKNGSELIGKSDFDFFTREQAEVMYADEQGIMATRKPMLWKDEHETMADGSERWFSTTKVPLCDDGGSVIGILGISRDETVRKRAELLLREQDKMLRDHIARVDAELNRARVVQQMLLPKPPAATAAMEIAMYSRPLEVVGGDYWAFPSLSSGRQGIFIGDLTGHGVSAALHMTLVNFICEQIWKPYGLKPARLLEALNTMLGSRMPGCFLTAAYATVKPVEAGLRIRLALAGHPSPLLVRADGSCELIAPNSSGALALFNDWTGKHTQLILAPGDSLLLYTDGLTEVWNPEEKLLGDRGLIEATRRLAGGTPQEMIDGILAATAAWRGSDQPDDDVLLMVIRARASEAGQ